MSPYVDIFSAVHGILEIEQEQTLIESVRTNTKTRGKFPEIIQTWLNDGTHVETMVVKDGLLDLSWSKFYT